jgi:hypothetical protein
VKEHLGMPWHLGIFFVWFISVRFRLAADDEDLINWLAGWRLKTLMATFAEKFIRDVETDTEVMEHKLNAVGASIQVEAI